MESYDSVMHANTARILRRARKREYVYVLFTRFLNSKSKRKEMRTRICILGKGFSILEYRSNYNHTIDLSARSRNNNKRIAWCFSLAAYDQLPRCMEDVLWTLSR